MEIKSLRTELHGIVANRLQRTSVATKIVQGIFLIAGALLAGLAQFVDGLKSLGIFGCILVFAAGIWILLVERNVGNYILDKDGTRPISNERDRPVIEVTPAMVEAGVMALEGTEDSSSPSQAKSVFQAMLHTLLSDSPSRHRLLQVLAR